MSQAAIKVWGTMALKEAFRILMPQFERSSGHATDVHWIPTVDMMQRLKAGERVDLVIHSLPNIEELVSAGVLAADVVPLARSGVAMAVRAGARKPDIGSADALKRALLAANSLAYSLGPSGVHMARLVERFGIAQTLEGRTKITKGEPVGAVVARGDAELGFQQLSELLPVAGIDIVGPLPPDAQEINVFTAGVHVHARNPEAAAQLARFVAAPAAAGALRQTGLEPVV